MPLLFLVLLMLPLLVLLLLVHMLTMPLVRCYRVYPRRRCQWLKNGDYLILPLHRRKIYREIPMRVLYGGVSFVVLKVLYQVHSSAVGSCVKATFSSGPLEVWGHACPQEAHHGVRVASAYGFENCTFHPLLQHRCSVAIPGDTNEQPYFSHFSTGTHMAR